MPECTDDPVVSGGNRTAVGMRCGRPGGGRPVEVQHRRRSPGELVRRAAGGDEAAWAELVDQYTAMVWNICRVAGLGPHDAADVTQAVWMRLVENLDRLRDPDRVGSWLATTAKRERLRMLSRRDRHESTDELEIADPAPGPADQVEQHERVRVLAAALERLPEREQQLLRMLARPDRPSYAEVSHTLGMPVGSIGPTRIRALTRLRHEIEDPAPVLARS